MIFYDVKQQQWYIYLLDKELVLYFGTGSDITTNFLRFDTSGKSRFSPKQT